MDVKKETMNATMIEMKGFTSIPDTKFLRVMIGGMPAAAPRCPKFSGLKCILLRGVGGLPEPIPGCSGIGLSMDLKSRFFLKISGQSLKALLEIITIAPLS
jgi:hypothetical protein